MGMNFYVRLPKCDCCGRGEQEIHIGRSAVGWHFMFARQKFLNLNSAREWLAFLVRYQDHIVNEDGEKVQLRDLRARIDTLQESGKSLRKHYGWDADEDGYSISDGHEFS